MDHDQDPVKKLGKLIKDIKVAMLTTVEPDGTLRSRPMMAQQVEFDGALWFFTGASSPKVAEVQKDQRVGVSFASWDDQKYVSVSGRARLVRDKARLRELWHDVYKAWFPGGIDDPDLALLKVEVDQAEYWDAPSGKMVQLAGLAKAVVTGQRYEGGENAKVNL